MMTSTDILDADTDLASFVADEVGTYVFSLTVRDSGRGIHACRGHG